MKRKVLFVWLPAFIGLLLFCVSQIDLYLFKQDIFGVKIILAWEVVLVIAGLISSALVFFFGIVCLFKKTWLFALQSFVSPFLFIILFGVGGAMGAAYLNAT